MELSYNLAFTIWAITGTMLAIATLDAISGFADEKNRDKYWKRSVILSLIATYTLLLVSCSSKVEEEEIEIPSIMQEEVQEAIPLQEEQGLELVRIKSDDEALEEEVLIPPDDIEEEIDLSEYICFTATAYCSCRKCCGKWAAVNEARGYAIGAAGVELIPYCSVAIDNQYYKFGTVFTDTEGHEYIAADTGSGVKGPNRIDIYMDDHQVASDFGLQKIWLKVGE